MVVVAGLAPAIFLFALGVAGFFVTDFNSLPMAVMFLAAALINGLILVLLAYLLAANTWGTSMIGSSLFSATALNI